MCVCLAPPSVGAAGSRPEAGGGQPGSPLVWHEERRKKVFQVWLAEELGRNGGLCLRPGELIAFVAVDVRGDPAMK